MMRNKLRRPLAFLLSTVMIATMSGTPVHAAADRGQPESGLCERHTAHADGYALGSQLPEINARMEAAPSATFSVDEYYADDVAAVNAIIENNGLSAVKNAPKGWGFVEWNNESPKRIQSLRLTARNLTGKLEVSGLTSLKELNCDINELTELELGGLSSLKSLNCYRNQLTKLELDGLSSLENLKCGDNQLEALMVSGLSRLKELDCYGNELTELEVNGLSSLEILYCYNNQLKELDASGLSSLTNLSCHDNQLTKLEVGGLTSLKSLDCEKNQLTELKVNGLSSLEYLYCNTNQLKELDASGLSSLVRLACDTNQLATLEVGGLTSLQALYCENNQLKELDASDLSSLKDLYCYTNQLMELKVSGLTSLEELSCDDNQLTALELDGLSRMEKLYCYNNQLTELDASDLTSLTELYCNNNQLTALELGGLSGLTVLYCNTNQLKELEVSGLTSLKALYCYNNQLAVLELGGLSSLERLNCSINPLTALTDPSGHKLTVAKTGCGIALITDYDLSTGEADLTAVPAKKCFFAHWSGLPDGISSDSKLATVSLSGDLNVEAAFKTTLTEDMVTIPDQAYTGQEIRPEPAVSVDIDGEAVAFQNGVDFMCSYADNVSVGTASVTVTPTESGQLGGTAVTKAFEIGKADSEFAGGIILDHADGQYAYGETIVFSVTPAVKPALRSRASAERTVDFYCGETKLNAAPVPAAEGVAAAFSYDTGKKGVPLGAHAITAVYGGGGSLNGREESVTVTLNRKPLTVSGAAAADRPYDGTTEVAVSGTLNGAAPTDAVALSGNRGNTADANAGTNKSVTAAFTLSGADAGFYTLIQPEGVTATIHKADITIAADNKRADVGAAKPAFTYAVTGLVGGDALAAEPILTCNADMDVVGQYPIAVSGAAVPSDAADQSVTWSSSDAAVATVDASGTVTAVDAGVATITVATADGGKTADCIVTVEKKTPPQPTKYSVTVQAGTGGAASASPISAKPGTNISLTATPDIGYHFREWQVMSGGVTISGNGFAMPAANVTVKAVFEKDGDGGGNSGGTDDGDGNSGGTGGSTIEESPDPTVAQPSVPKVKSFRAKAGKKKLTLSWKKVSGAAGYQIQVSAKKGFKRAKTISVSKSKRRYAKKGLKAKKKYYVRIRAYKTYLDKNGETKRAYGKWTGARKKTK